MDGEFPEYFLGKDLFIDVCYISSMTLEIEKWIQNKPLFTSTMAIEIALGSSDYFVALQKIKKGTFDLKFSQIPPIEKWISFYKNHRTHTEGIFADFYNLGGTAELGVDFQYTLIELQKLQNEQIGGSSAPEENKTLRSLNDIFEYVIDQTIGREQYLEMFFQEIASGIDNIENTEEDNKIQEIIQHPEMIFFLKVIAPCWLFYRTHPTLLLRKARLGDEDAIDKLLRIDKSVIADPILSKHFAESSFKKNKYDFNTYLKALKNQPKGKPSLRNVKFFFATSARTLLKFGRDAVVCEITAILPGVLLPAENLKSRASDLFFKTKEFLLPAMP